MEPFALGHHGIARGHMGWDTRAFCDGAVNVLWSLSLIRVIFLVVCVQSGSRPALSVHSSNFQNRRPLPHITQAADTTKSDKRYVYLTQLGLPQYLSNFRYAIKSCYPISTINFL